MSVDSKGYCLTDNKDVFKITALVESSIDNLITSAAIPKGRMRYDEKNKWISKEIVGQSEMIIFSFKYKNEQRSVHFNFGCDTDGSADGLIGQKLIFSIGMWGESEVIIKAIGNSLASLGPVYLQLNDCRSDEPFILIPPTLESISQE